MIELDGKGLARRGNGVVTNGWRQNHGSQLLPPSCNLPSSNSMKSNRRCAYNSWGGTRVCLRQVKLYVKTL